MLVTDAPRVEGDAATFAGLLRLFRAREGLTQERLAEQAGCSPATIAALEQGLRRRPYPHTLRSISRALELDSADHANLLRATGVPDRPGRPPGLKCPQPAPLRDPVVHAPASATPLIARQADIAAVSALLVVPQPAARLLNAGWARRGGQDAFGARRSGCRSPDDPPAVWSSSIWRHSVTIASFRRPSAMPCVCRWRAATAPASCCSSICTSDPRCWFWTTSNTC